MDYRGFLIGTRRALNGSLWASMIGVGGLVYFLILNCGGAQLW